MLINKQNCVTMILNKGRYVMQIQAKFEKVSFKQFAEHGDRQTYDGIKLPRRATKCSAGYDFYAPTNVVFEAGQTVTIATGIRAAMPSGYFLMIVPRSGLGFKYKLRLNNTVGIIDADYVLSPNEGHIFVRMTNESDKRLEIKKGEAYAQGILLQYFTTVDDNVTDERQGGLGSTSKGA